jgi:hypothetical protein
MRALGRLLAFRLFAASTILLPFLAAPATVQAREGKPLAATYANGRLALTIPYHTDRAGSGQLVVELLDPEDKVLGRSARSYDVDKGDGVLEPYLTPDEKLSLDDLVWERLRFRFAYRGESDAAFEGIKSISQILRRPQVHVLGQRSYLSGGKAAIRIIATDSSGEAIAGRSSARVELLGAGASPLLLFHGELNRRGTAEAQFQYPAGVSGACRLHYIVDTPIGSAETTQAVTLEEKASILLTTEKPIYQPGQTIHARALALDV